MERLTSKYPSGVVAVPKGMMPEALERLYAYEDTGLEPGDIVGLKNTCDQLYGINDSLFNANQAMGNDLAEWKKAESEGRMVVLPCKVGDTVWYIRGEAIHEVEVCLIRPFISSNEVEFRGNALWTFTDPFWEDGRTATNEVFIIFGKDTFLTREEAEAALKGEGNDDNS